jgi:hypothetical protein
MIANTNGKSKRMAWAAWRWGRHFQQKKSEGEKKKHTKQQISEHKQQEQSEWQEQSECERANTHPSRPGYALSYRI